MGVASLREGPFRREPSRPRPLPFAGVVGFLFMVAPAASTLFFRLHPSRPAVWVVGLVGCWVAGYVMLRWAVRVWRP